MVYKTFRFQLVLRIVLIILTIVFLFFCVTKTNWIITSSITGIIFFIQIIELINYADKVNRDLSRFLLAIKHRDFSQTFASEGKGKSFNELRDAFNIIIKEFQKISSEKELHHYYLQTIIEHTSIGIIAIANDENVELINQATRDLLGINYIKNYQSIERYHPVLTQTLKRIKTGEKEVISIELNGENLQLSVQVSELIMDEKKIKIYSLQNIKSELEEQEIEAWQKLIRVLTHEIMNSVTPITSLTESTISMLETNRKENNNQLDTETINDIYTGLTTIQKRSKGLLNFVDVYRNLTRIPKPNPVYFKANEAITNVISLLDAEFKNKKIKLNYTDSSSNASVFTDKDLLEQVLINLILNAIEALKTITIPEIKINNYTNENNKTIIEIIDNGNGIDPDIIDKIFIPFYTTKENGSGIGLSLSRQILKQQGGNITVRSEKNKGTTMTIKI
jgi:two-component system, NtrC family, nitrogen regulation sensor histidine kinase NtrY